MFFHTNNFPNAHEYSQILQTQAPIFLPPLRQSYLVPYTESHALTYTALLPSVATVHPYGGGSEDGSHHHKHLPEHFLKDRKLSDQVENARDDAIQVFLQISDRPGGKEALQYLNDEINDSVLSDIFLDSIYDTILCRKPSETRTDDSIWFLAFKIFVLIFVFSMYITCFYLIMESMRSISSCEDELTKKGAGPKQDQPYYYCQNIGTHCRFDWMGQNFNVKSYLVARMASYIVSAVPFAFMIYAKQRHLKNWINKVMGKDTAKRDMYRESKEDGHAIKYIKTLGANLDKDALKLISLIMFFLIYNAMGVFIFVLDIYLFKFFNLDSNDKEFWRSKGCKNIITSGKDDTNFINYVDEKGKTMNIEILCSLLLGLNAVYFTWSVIYTFIGCCGLYSHNNNVKAYHEEEAKINRAERKRCLRLT